MRGFVSGRLLQVRLRSAWRPALLAVWASVAGVACGGETVIQSDLTGVEMNVRFDPGLAVDQLVVSGVVDGAQAFAPGAAPVEPRLLDGEGESVVVLVDEALAGANLLVRADGLYEGGLVTSGQEGVTVAAQTLVPLTLTLGEPALCGDGVIRAGIEACDDGNTVAADGCSALCLLEPGASCSGEPSACLLP